MALGGEGALACAELHEVDTLRDIGSMTQVTPLLLAALLSLPLAGGCASACKRVAADRQEFLARPVQTSAPQMALVLPLAALSQEMTRKLARARPMSLNLPRPGIAGFDLDLGAASARLTSITVLPAADDHLGFRVAVGLGSGNQAIATIELEAEVRPQLDLSRGAVTVSLSPRDIASLRPRLPPAEERRLGDFLWSKVPGLARQLIDRGTIDGVVRQLSRDLLGPMWPKIRDSLLADVGTLTEFTIDLPDELPIAALALRSSPADLELAVTLALPASGLARARGRSPGTPAGLPQVRISGSAVAELANAAMRGGSLPERYTREGSPSPSGEFEAGVTWVSGARPLKVHVWSTAGDCTYVRFGGTPSAAVRGEQVRFAVDDGALERSMGSAKVRMALWLGGVGRRTFEVSESAASSLRFELFGAPMRARATSVQIGADEVALGIVLTEEPAARRR